MGYLNLALFAVAAFTIFKSADSLQCWSCSSDMGAPCADHFNTTLHNRYGYRNQNFPVELQNCDEHRPNYQAPSTQKAVCMKKKQTTYGRTTFIRQCRFLHYEEKIGKCPTETTGSATTIDFCEYCDYDGCNAATSIQQTLVLTLLAPVCAFLLFRK